MRGCCHRYRAGGCCCSVGASAGGWHVGCGWSWWVLITALPHNGRVYVYTAFSRQTSFCQQTKPQTTPYSTAANPTPTTPTAKPESQTNDRALEAMMNSVRKMCQHVNTNLQQQNSLTQVLQKSFNSQQEIIQKQGHHRLSSLAISSNVSQTLLWTTFRRQ